MGGSERIGMNAEAADAAPKKKKKRKQQQQQPPGLASADEGNRRSLASRLAAQAVRARSGHESPCHIMLLVTSKPTEGRRTGAHPCARFT
jgi:hypothetical protein